MPGPKHTPKIQRWIDLLAALLRHHYAVDFEQLAREVPAYNADGKKRAAVMRMFERDKDELRAYGVPIEGVMNEDGVPDRYRLASKAFYMPYLQVVCGGRPAPPKRASGYGYQGLRVLAFEPDELGFIVRAARRAQQLGDPQLALEATGALRKLAFDIAITGDGEHERVATDPQGDSPAVLDTLDDAVRRRKTVTLDYRSMERNSWSRRSVQPLGLVFTSGNWYLLGVASDANALRHFRASRIRNVTVNALRSQSPDFDAPAGFDLAAHAASRNAWELGDGDAVQAVVRFDNKRGAVANAIRLGEPDGSATRRRRFRVRRVDTFARWLLSFAGDAVPLSPAAVVTAWREAARKTAAIYGARA